MSESVRIRGADLVSVQWLREGRRVVAATLIDAVGSSPFEAGAAMYVDAGGAVEGSVTGGCVEAALVEEAAQVLAGAAPRVVTYGISDDVAAGVGLMCGGTVKVLVAELSGRSAATHLAAYEAVKEGRTTAIATLVDGPDAGGKIALVDDQELGGFEGDLGLDAAVKRDARGALAAGHSVLRSFGASGREMGADVRVWVDVFVRPPRLLIFGAIDHSIELSRMGRLLGFESTICDARAPFIGSARFGAVAEVVVDWPDRYLEKQDLDRRDAVLVFTHDRKFDEPALQAALASGAGYVGALGSRRTQADRAQRLLELGVPPADLQRLAAPCGLDLGARTPSETALAILAEIVALRAGREGGRLVDASGNIRGRSPAAPDPEPR